MWPVFFSGSSTGRMIFWPAARPLLVARFSASVLPVTVMQSPSISPLSSRYFIRPLVPPIECRSSCTNFPLGLRSARYGMRRATFWKSAGARSTLTARAIAIRWRTALVEPPSAITVTMAFSNARRVMMSRGLRSSSSRWRIAAPARRHSSALPGCSAGIEALSGSDMPKASIAVAMVLAVYIPPQAPAPGQEWRTMSPRRVSSIRPATYSP